MKNSVHETNSRYWNTKGNDLLQAISLPLYGSFVSEEKHQLFGDVSGKKLLEIGCGNGESLQYHGERKAAELWALDISEKQIQKAKQHLQKYKLSANFICSPMEADCGIPKDYFDFVYSIYAVGWTTDIERTFHLIASYLKKGGVFIFSWSHPMHKCLTRSENIYQLEKCYYDETPYFVPEDFCGGELILSDYILSTYINALAKAGFCIEQMIEKNDDELMNLHDENNNLFNRAKLFPVTFVIKARKLGAVYADKN
jgi:cyclopropane fatty-acyl-phospholipid synthase-like methyltransferase